MKLTDLDAQFTAPPADGDPRKQQTQDGINGAWGLMFQCPKCAEGLERGEEDGRRHVKGAHYIGIHFANPSGAPVAGPEVDHNPRWLVSGTGLADLTLSPSINLTGPGCGWHGFLRGGELISV